MSFFSVERRQEEEQRRRHEDRAPSPPSPSAGRCHRRGRRRRLLVGGRVRRPPPRCGRAPSSARRAKPPARSSMPMNMSLSAPVSSGPMPLPISAMIRSRMAIAEARPRCADHALPDRVLRAEVHVVEHRADAPHRPRDGVEVLGRLVVGEDVERHRQHACPATGTSETAGSRVCEKRSIMKPPRNVPMAEKIASGPPNCRANVPAVDAVQAADHRRAGRR